MAKRNRTTRKPAAPRLGEAVEAAARDIDAAAKKLMQFIGQTDSRFDAVHAAESMVCLRDALKPLLQVKSASFMAEPIAL